MNQKINDNTILTYYPNRRNLFVLPIFIFAGGFSIWCGIDLCLQGNNLSLIVPLLVIVVICVLCCFCAIIFYRSAQQCVLCSTDGLFVQASRCMMPEFIPFCGEFHIYETTNVKGHYYYLFSREQLTKQQMRRIANKSSLLMKMKVDHTFVVWDNSSSDAKQFAQILKSNIEK